MHWSEYLEGLLGPARLKTRRAGLRGRSAIEKCKGGIKWSREEEPRKALNQAETVCYQANKLLENDETPEAEKSKIQGIVSELQTAITKEDYASMKDLMTQFTNMQAAASTASANANESTNDDVIDTDFSAEK